MQGSQDVSGYLLGFIGVAIFSLTPPVTRIAGERPDRLTLGFAAAVFLCIPVSKRTPVTASADARRAA